MVFRLEQFFELFDAETSIACNAAHRECVYRIEARNRNNTNTIRHNDMFALAQNSKASLFESLHCFKMINARNFRHAIRPPLLPGHAGP
jgi:hypothetical protein